jgi:hypothetical protein
MVLKLVNFKERHKEYCDVIDNLAQANKLENLKGNFVRLVCQEDKFAHLEYVESQTLVKRFCQTC